ncbi:hypothetical protein BCR37DRAFT_377646 [Protomyces lactucae-debilis]|uniref:Uncharacterized protein n=1 Tax=Protomyces lactucae-debilis TaxID=2754530 RepID=A0A1Y2FLG0_PROLT|nr:uncharacterized protein BCR37DRAFT_377646 [Protomyces lactucae-debilis]ORY84832.1 hypothetical protein BCR37DRAFT_377646 [Protomyces lactucae-debilis]
MGLWPRTPLRDATWNTITAHTRYLMNTHQIVVDAQGKTVTWRHRNVGKLQTVIHKLEKAFPVLERAHGHWIALTICQHHAKVVNEAGRLLLLLLPKTMTSATRTTLSMERHLLASMTRTLAARHPLPSSLKTMILTRLHRELKHWLTRCSVKQTRMRMFPRQVRPIFDVIRLTSGQKSSKDRSTSSSRKSGRTSKLSRRAQDAEQGSTTMTKAKTAASQAKKARKSAKKAKKAAARL